jgi:MFS family permease
VAGWFDNRRGTAFGVLMTGSSLGGVLFPIMITHLIPQVGYGWAMRIAAFLILFLLLIANLTVRSRIKLDAPKLAAKDLRHPFHELTFLLVIGGFALFTFGMYVPVNFLVLEAIAKGMVASLAQYLVSIFNAAR